MIAAWHARFIAVCHRVAEGPALVATIGGEGILTMPLLAGFAAPPRIFAGFPPAP